MNCQLYLALAPLQLAEPGLPSPSLERLLAVGGIANRQELFESALCRAFGISQQSDWPVAPLSWLGEGNDPAAFYWLCADPVHFVLQRDYFSLSDPVPLSLSRQEAQALIAALNRHFEVDGLQFHFAGSGRWYLRLNKEPAMSTSMPVTVIGRDVSAYLPQGAGAAKWNRLLNEMQMLLHDHPVNQAREANGELPVNSLWLSGGGVLPAKLEVSPRRIFANNALAKGLAITANLPCVDLPENAEALLKPALLNQTQADVVLVLDSVDEVEFKWFLPLLTALRRRKIRQLTLHFSVRDQTLSVNIRPRDLWKFWRRPKPLKDCFSW